MLVTRATERAALSSRLLLAGVGAAALLPFLLLIGLAVLNRVAASREEELDRIRDASQSLALALERELKSYADKARVIAGLRALTADGVKSARATLVDAKAAIGGDFVLLDASGQQLASTRVADGSPLPQTRNLALLEQAIASGGPLVSDLAIGTVSGVYDYGVFLPFTTQAGAQLVLAYLPPIDAVQKVVKDQIGAGPLIGAVLDGQGRIVARTERQDRLFGELASPEFRSRLIGRAGLLRTVDLQQRPSYTAYHALQLSRWNAVVWVPEAVVHAPGWSIFRSMLIAVAAALLLSLTAGHLIAKLVRGPIEHLLDSARTVGQGLVPVPKQTWMHEANLVSNALTEAARELQWRQTQVDQARALGRQNETRFRELVAGLRDAVVWEGDPDTLTFTYVSEGAEKLLGYPVLRWICDPRFWLEHVHPDDREHAASFCRAESIAGRDHELEYRMLAADGRTVWVRDAVFITVTEDRRVARGIMVDITRAKQADEILRNRERLYHELTDNSPVMLWISDARGRCLHLNKRLRDFWGVPEDALEDFDWSATMHPDDAPAIGQEVVAAIGAHRPFTVQGRYKTSSGGYRVLKTDAVPRFDDNGRFIGMLGANIDVTESVAAATALTESEERLQIAARAAGLGVFEWHIAIDDAEFENPRMLEILGHAPDDRHLSKRIFMESYIHPEDAEPFERTLETALATTRSLNTSCRIRRKSDGVWRWIEIAGNIIVDGNGVPDRLIGVAADITSRKEAEAELSRTSTLLKSVCDGVDDLIFVKDRDSRFLFANPATAKVLGVPADQVVGRTGLEDMGNAAEVDAILANDRHVIATGTPLAVEERFSGADGPRTYFSNKAPLRDGQGNIVGLVAVVRDITERKAAEEQTKLLLREVSHRAKNILAVTQAIVRQTARDCDPKTFTRNVSGRLAGLAASHDLLVEGGWRSVAMRDLVVAQLPHCRDLIGKRLFIDGPAFGLKPAATQTLGMALHELATNAGKYGALSNDQGTVHLKWCFKRDGADPRIEMSWEERGGPAVDKPQRHGFGHAVTTRLVETGLEATVTLDYGRDGVLWCLDAPLSRLVDDTAQASPAHPSLEVA